MIATMHAMTTHFAVSSARRFLDVTRVAPAIDSASCRHARVDMRHELPWRYVLHQAHFPFAFLNVLLQETVNCNIIFNERK